MMQNTDKKPWYRYPFVWMIIAIPSSAVIMGFHFFWLAVTSDDGLVADDYYKQGMAINRNLERDSSAKDNSISALFEMSNTENWIKLALDKGVLDTYPDTLQLKLQYAVHDHNDVDLVLNHGQGNQYIGIIKQPLIDGKWYLEVSHGAWRLNGHFKADKPIKLQLEPL